MKQSISVALLLFFSSSSYALFTEDPQNVTALLGTQAFFNCSFEDLQSFPRWQDTTGVSYTTSDTTGDVRFVQISNTSISLNVTATEARDGVCYFCIADIITSPIMSESGCLTVAGPPDAPVVTQTGATLDSVTVSWTEAGSNPLYPVTGYYVLFNGTATMVGLNRTYVITGLMSGTTYSVGVLGRNAAGEGEVGSVNASTPNPLVPPAPVNVRSMVTFTSGSPSLLILWEAPVLSDQQAPITSYTVHYMVKGSSLNTTVADINPNTSRFMVPNVSAEDEYYIKVVAVNSAGSSPAAAVVATVTYLQGLAYVSEDVSFTCNFAFGIDFDSLLCSLTIDGGPAVYVDVTAGSPPSATYTAAGLEEGSHTVRAQAVRRSDRLPIESFNISKPFTILADDQDGNGSTFTGSIIATQLLGVLAVMVIVFGMI